MRPGSRENSVLCKTKLWGYRKYLSKDSLLARIIYELRHIKPLWHWKEFVWFNFLPTNLDPNNWGMNYQEIWAHLSKEGEESDTRKIANIDNCTGPDWWPVQLRIFSNWRAPHSCCNTGNSLPEALRIIKNRLLPLLHSNFYSHFQRMDLNVAKYRSSKITCIPKPKNK